MSELEKLEMLKSMFVTDGSDGSEAIGDDVLLSYLRMAGSIVINRAYPYKNDVAEVPPKYAMNQVQIAIFLLNKRGAEGESAHNENGINRTYENGDNVPYSMLRNILPVVKLL